MKKIIWLSLICLLPLTVFSYQKGDFNISLSPGLGNKGEIYIFGGEFYYYQYDRLAFGGALEYLSVKADISTAVYQYGYLPIFLGARYQILTGIADEGYKGAALFATAGLFLAPNLTGKAQEGSLSNIQFKTMYGPYLQLGLDSGELLHKDFAANIFLETDFPVNYYIQYNAGTTKYSTGLSFLLLLKLSVTFKLNLLGLKK